MNKELNSVYPDEDRIIRLSNYVAGYGRYSGRTAETIKNSTGSVVENDEDSTIMYTGEIVNLLKMSKNLAAETDVLYSKRMYENYKRERDMLNGYKYE